MKTKFWRLSPTQLASEQTYVGKDNSIFVVTKNKFILIRDKETRVCWNKEFILNTEKPITLTRKRNSS